jgi:hypothetical protein
MGEVVEWIVQTLTFNRIYFYGKDRPIHISYSSLPAKVVIDMVKGPSGVTVPRQRRLKQ